jgi:hypothetical protein
VLGPDPQGVGHLAFMAVALPRPRHIPHRDRF